MAQSGPAISSSPARVRQGGVPWLGRGTPLAAATTSTRLECWQRDGGMRSPARRGLRDGDPCGALDPPHPQHSLHLVAMMIDGPTDTGRCKC